MRNNVLKNLEYLSSDIQMSKDQKKEVENLVMASVSQDLFYESKKPAVWVKVVDALVPANMAMQPVAVFILVIGLVFVSSFGSINAAKDTLPGDTLYPVKITAENIKYGLALSHESKAREALTLVEKRVGELKVIMQNENNGLRAQKVSVTSRKIKENLNQVKEKINIIKEKANEEELAETVNEMNDKLVLVKDEILSTSEEVEEEMSEELVSVVEEVEEASLVLMAALDEKVAEGKVEGAQDEEEIVDEVIEEIVEPVSAQALVSEEEELVVEELVTEVTTTNKLIIEDIEEVQSEEFKVKIGQ